MNRDKIPTNEECYSLMKPHMLPNIFEHSKQVMYVANEILENLIDDIILDRQLINAAALLHDITKTKSLKTKEPHDLTGADFLRQLDFSRVADIVENHVYLKSYEPDGKLLEKEIVYYADKRVMHEKIVPVKKRMNDIILRYGKNEEIIGLIKKNTALILEVEKKINRYSLKDLNNLF